MSEPYEPEGARAVHVQGVHVNSLVQAAQSVGLGVEFCRSEQNANLYVWVTRAGAVLYVGKKESARRIANEETWAASFDVSRYRVGFVALVARHQAERKLLTFDGQIDTLTVLRALEEYEGSMFDNLRRYIEDGGHWSVRDVELVLIRMMILAEFPVGNSQGAGQWESSWGRREDALAAVAVINSPKLSIPDEAKKALAEPEG